ncbi:peptide-N4-asparagine amidase [Sphingomonas silueang]|uniref:peptide-N4-asparagine amidase n=1 Tax=Sphingomonas silueang TaxID=3156617 RepID=UPI0032B35968
MAVAIMRAGAMLAPLFLAGAGIAADGPVASVPIGDRVIDLTPPVPRPGTRHCTVTLFDRREFRGEAPLALDYRPPADCPGPWRKVVLEADFDVTAGLQYDRTADLTIGGATLFVGTTMEPGKDYAPHWHVERDVTDLAAVLRQPADGAATLVNFLDGDHTGRVSWGARLVFYAGDAPAGHQVVVPVTAGFVDLSSREPTVSRTLTLPRNMTGLQMDLFAIGQQRDEFWFDCIPPGFARPNPFPAAPCTPFREVEVRIDGQLAAIHAVQPVIFTGGINPALWRRAPGLHALNLPSARLDLTPFAGVLNDGRPHDVTLAMPAVGTLFRLSGTLIATVDPMRPVVPGALVASRLSPAMVATRQTRPGTQPDRTGTLVTTARRSGYAEGYVETSRGRTTTRVAYDLDMQVIATRDDGRYDKWYDARHSTTVTTRGGRSRTRRIDDHDVLTIVMPVDPPRHGVKYGTQITQTKERAVSDEAGRRNSALAMTTFAPTSSVFTAPRETPNRVTVTSHVRDARGRCRRTGAVVADDSVARSERTACPSGR